MKILRDNRNDGGYDLLTCTGAAATLTDGDKFSFYVTTVSVKEARGIKVCTFADSTHKKDKMKKYKIEFNSDELSLLLFVLKKSIETVIIKIADSEMRNYSNEKQYKSLIKMQKRLQQTIIKG